MPPYTPSTLNIIHASQNASQIQMQEEREEREEREMLEQERKNDKKELKEKNKNLCKKLLEKLITSCNGTDQPYDLQTKDFERVFVERKCDQRWDDLFLEFKSEC
jgi:hypothetical protein